MSVPDDKRSLRRQALEGREQITPDVAQAAPHSLAELALASVFADLPDVSIVSAYHPYKGEISPLPLMARLNQAGYITALPVVVAKAVPLIFRRWYPHQPLTRGVMDIAVPEDHAPQVSPDLLLVPLLAFDRHGYRLGYGGGFYDRTLAQLRGRKKIVAVGVGYAAQEVKNVAHDNNDQRLDWVITESEVMSCG